MYMMVRINFSDFTDITGDLEFCKKLLNEEFVLTFPASSFFSKDGFRVVICQSHSNIEEAGARIKAFCERHTKKEEEAQ